MSMSCGCTDNIYIQWYCGILCSLWLYAYIYLISMVDFYCLHGSLHSRDKKKDTYWPDLLNARSSLVFWPRPWKEHGTCSQNIFSQTHYFNFAVYIGRRVHHNLKCNYAVNRELRKLSLSLLLFTTLLLFRLWLPLSSHIKSKKSSTKKLIFQVRWCFSIDAAEIQSSVRVSLHGWPIMCLVVIFAT